MRIGYLLKTARHECCAVSDDGVIHPICRDGKSDGRWLTSKFQLKVEEHYDFSRHGQNRICR